MYVEIDSISGRSVNEHLRVNLLKREKYFYNLQPHPQQDLSRQSQTQHDSMQRLTGHVRNLCVASYNNSLTLSLLCSCTLS